MTGIGNHLWQSTLFAVLVWILTLAVRQNQAQVRYRLWLAASLKFLVPFSLLLAAGSRIEWHSAPAAAPPVAAAVEQFTQPFALVRVNATPAQSSILPWFLALVWVCGFAVVALRWWKRWRRVRAALRTASRTAIEGPVAVMMSEGRFEPGVFGVFRPVLVLPAGITERLSPAQLQAVLAHEFCHVRRRDNLFAALHMMVEAVFWFHPLVWWLGARLVEERERACDEDVLQAGSDPESYAAGILNVCKLYLETPLACSAGVTGADLKRRIEAIMTGSRLQGLTLARKLLLAAAGIAALGAPLMVGVVSQGKAQTGTPLRFEVASLKRTKEGGMKAFMQFLPGGGLRMDGVTLKSLIAFAYEVMEDQVSGGPRWMDTDAYDLLAKAEKSDAGVTEAEANMAAPGTPVWNRVRLRTQELLKDRFQLVVHVDSKPASGYELVLAKGGSKLKPTTSTNPPGTMRSMGRIDGRAGTMGMLAVVLSNYVGHPVVDHTGLNDHYDYKLTYAQDPRPGEADPAPMGPSLLAALEEQLGLKLEKSRVEIRTIIVDRAERASEN